MNTYILKPCDKISFKYNFYSVKGIGKLKTVKAVKEAIQLGIEVIVTLNKKGKELE